MSLTTDDLQAIGTLIDQKLEQKLEQKFEEKLAPIKAEQQAQSKTLKYLKNKVNRMNKTVDIIAIRYDERLVENKKEIDEINEHLRIPFPH